MRNKHNSFTSSMMDMLSDCFSTTYVPNYYPIWIMYNNKAPNRDEQVYLAGYSKENLDEAYEVLEKIRNSENADAWNKTVKSIHPKLVLYDGKHVYKLPQVIEDYSVNHVHPSLDENFQPVWTSPKTISITDLNTMLKTVDDKRFNVKT